MNIRLEYSQALGQFNQAKADHTPDKARGFVTLCCFVNADRAGRFVEHVTEKYPALATGKALDYPEPATLKKDLLHFLDEEIRLLNQQMAQTFKRRQAIFTNRSSYNP